MGGRGGGGPVLAIFSTFNIMPMGMEMEIMEIIMEIIYLK